MKARVPAANPFRPVQWLVATALALLMANPWTSAQTPDPSEIGRLRRQLKHEEAMERLKSGKGETFDPVLLSKLTLEASLLNKLGPPHTRTILGTKGAVEKLATLALSGREELTLAELCYFLELEREAEDAVTRAREKSFDLKNRTDELLAEHRGEDVPRGGYLRYRGRYIPMEERHRCQALDQALEGLYALELDGLSWRFIPSGEESNRDRFVSRYGEEGTDFLRRAADLLGKELQAMYKEVRSWIPSYAGTGLRQRIQQFIADLTPLRKEALELIARYDKPEQPEVDEFRKKLEALYGEYERLIDANLAKLRGIRPDEGYALWKRMESCEEALADIDRYFTASGLPALEEAGIRPGRGAEVTDRHLLPGREPTNLEDVLWLAVNHAAGRTLDVLQRSEELLLQERDMTPWEQWFVRMIRIDAIERYNREAATSLDKEERAFVEILNRYRKMMGLIPFEVEERCIVAARKHSQEMVDLGYFGHISPIRRNRTPTDRVKLEGFGGGVGENCLAGGGPVNARGAFEGWYHSPGHHRLLVSGSPQVGVGAASEHRMWTMVAGGTDLTWRSLHQDLPAEQRAVCEILVARFSEGAKRGNPSVEMAAKISEAMPEVLPVVAREAFAAVHDKAADRQVGAPALLKILIDAEVFEIWRPLQVAAVSAAIDLMDLADARNVREAAFALVRPLVPEAFGYDPMAVRSRRQSAILEIRKSWEDEAQWQYRRSVLTGIREPETPPDRPADGPALAVPLKVLDRKERARLAKRFGGGEHTEKAVELGLAWLARVQSEDGAWRSRSFAERIAGRQLAPRELGLGNHEWEIAMTGLALLAFIYAGNTTLEGEYRETVERAADFLMARIVDYGMFETTSSHYMYGHAMATQALCELYAYTADPHIGIGAQLCVDYLIYAQDPVTGGWRYQAKEAGDTSVSGWVILAMHSARKADLDVAGLRDALRFLDGVTYPGYYQYGYTSNKDGGHNRLCAVGSLARLFIIGTQRDAKVIFNAKRLLRDLPRIGAGDFYYWYYGTLFMFQMGGDYWDQWNEGLVPALQANQVSEPNSPLHGSFDPRGEWSDQGGRIYQTSLGLLMLMTYYRYERELKPKVGPWTGSIRQQAGEYMDKLRHATDAVVLEVTERKVLDKFGPSLAPLLMEELKKEGEKAAYRERLASMLSRCAQTLHEPYILELLSSERNGKVTELLVQALDGISTSGSVPTLVACLDDGNHKVRGYCASALGRIGDPAAVAPLSERLEVEKDGWCRALIEEALQRLAHQESLTLLLNDALRKKDKGRLAIQESLKILERSGLAKMLLAAKDSEPRLYGRIKTALREHREWAAVPLALIGLESSDLDTRFESRKVLRDITRQSHGFDPEASKEKRQAAVKKWNEWWKKHLEEYRED